MENNKYLYEIILEDGKNVKDVIDAKDLIEAFHMIDNVYGLSDNNYKELSIERLRKGY